MSDFIPTGLGTILTPPDTRVRRPVDRRSQREELRPPPRPLTNFIPTTEAIQMLIERALTALSEGIYWDRGSIINLVL